MSFALDYHLSVNVSYFFAAVGLGCGLYVFSVIAYRLTVHPLASYPGPILAKITDWYNVYHAWKGDRHLELWRIHQVYGDVVRFGPNSVSINTSTALRDIYGFKANVKKSNFYTVFPATKGAFSTHTAIDKSVHARKRRVLSQAFSDSAMRAMETHVLNNIRSWCGHLGDWQRRSKADINGPLYGFIGQQQALRSGTWSTPKNMGDWANYLSFDVLGDLCFGKPFGVMDSEKNRFVLDLIPTAAYFHNVNGQMPMIKKLGFDSLLFGKIKSKREKYMAYSKEQMAARTKQGIDGDRRDFFYHLLKARDPETGQGFGPLELWGESNVLLIAGSDTTSTALAATFFYLTHNPPTLTKLTASLRSTFPSLESIRSGPLLTSTPYLRACLDEAMRLSPPVGGLLPREVLPGGITIDGHHFPAGTDIGTPHYALHHKEDYFPDAFAYKPERWLVGADVTAESVELAHSAFCPFSVGPRGCIGKGIAYLELSIAVARVVWLYDVRLASGGAGVGEGRPDGECGRRRREEYQLFDAFVAMKDGPLVEFKARSE
ncbi:MAG: hypothetical protein M1830_003014 [Pleopsidium flavum]|nr:MAG: hypothetical protein M1830_003014 [Pleopsidium flavum]